jgi:hypothetical protein
MTHADRANIGVRAHLVRIIFAPAEHLRISLQFRMDLKPDSGIVCFHAESITEIDFFGKRSIFSLEYTPYFKTNFYGIKKP